MGYTENLNDLGGCAGLDAHVAAVTSGKNDSIALMATSACETHHSDPRFDSMGFCRVVLPGLLEIAPYPGGRGCLIGRFQRGVCGVFARSGEVQLVPDVDAFPGVLDRLPS